jgi:predicted 3-demethylubiquinone-9 3-methyltransferase (glyoxalase superfamily)
MILVARTAPGAAGLAICFWFDTEAENAAKFYTGVLLCMQRVD